MEETTSREIIDLKREVVETRNQVIKADNQVKNLALDIKSFERRFEMLERRARFGSLGVNILVAVVVSAAAYMVYSVRAKALNEEVAKAGADATEARQSAQVKADELRTRLGDFEQERRRSAEATSVSKKILDQLDAGRQRDAVELLDRLEPQHLSELERRLMDKHLSELRKSAAEDALKAARKAMDSSRTDTAIEELKRAIRLDPSSRSITSAKYLLATQLWNVGRFSEVEPIVRDLIKTTTDRALLEELRYLHATTQAKLERRDEAKALFADLIAARTKYMTSAKAYMAALESGGELPGPTAAGSRTAARPATPTPAAAPAPAASPAPAPAPAAPPATASPQTPATGAGGGG